MIAGIVLAAGASRRLGEAKQGVRVGADTLLERAVRVAVEAGLEPVLVVVSAGLVVENCLARVDGFRVVLNEAAEEGMASSIRAGVGAVREGQGGVDGVVVMACDQPAVTAEHLRELMAGGDEVVGSGYAGRRGVPAYFPARVFGELMELRGDVGARQLLRGARCVVLADGELDVDTREELERARELFG